jgi:phospholipid/cholesterol/gamma-HCH transport system substrate-binding protein
VPSRKEIQWSQLKVGSLVLAAVAVLIGLLFLMTGSSGGLFARKITLRSYFSNAAGVKEGAPVTLEGVTIGNVSHMRVVPDRNPTPVEVTMQVGERYLRDLHTDSISSIAQAGVLGDSYVDIDSTKASGPAPLNNAELQTSISPTIQEVISNSDISIQEINDLMHKFGTLIDTLNTKRGTVGELINDPVLAKKVVSIATNIETVTGTVAQGKGSLGKVISDETLYNKVNSTVDQLNSITADLNAGKGSAGKFLKDETIYNNLNTAVTNVNQLISQINSGNGSIGKIVKDPAFAQKLDDALTNLDTILKGINSGKGSAGQFVQNRAFYDHLDQTMDQAQQLIKSMRENPKKYLVVQLKVF